tara:strand:+ start:990 stop:1829 length:840 start_codon:yes stop_codon:yes gene_type:complete
MQIRIFQRCVFGMAIKAWWYKTGGNNFGDVICPILLRALTGQEIEFSRDEGTLVSIGSVAFHPYDNKMLFWGSGALKNKSKQKHQHAHRILAVRGPRTRECFLREGFDCPEVYGDPGIILPLLYPREAIANEQRIEIGILPHHVDYERVAKFKVVQDERIKVIDICGQTIEVLKAITACDLLITSSLHGLIVGEAYSIPTAFIEFGKKLYGRLFKFEDYFNSTNRELSYYRCHREWSFNINKIEKFIAKKRNPEFNRRKLLRAFPYPITHPGVLEFLNR